MPAATSSIAAPILGAALGELRARLIDAGTRLRATLDDASGSAVAEILDRLRQQVCQIAVLGQTKAGKSTLVNSFVRAPGLLPTDVNPWTGVVTNLHFHAPGGPKRGAVFQFFDEAEWQALIEDGGRMGALLKRLGLDIDDAAPLDHARALDQRTRRMLGERFACLLGKQHRFNSLQRDTLEQYVCMGDGEQEGGGRAGRFACITKCADIFMDSECFGLPATVTDTPGTNDPFLSRSDLTRKAIGIADVYIVVLNCQQALTIADLDLLHMLQGLHKRRVVVFVNRIDLLQDAVKDSAMVVEHVQSQLDREFPDIKIPVVAGSALWAERAMRPLGEFHASVTVALAAVARHQRLIDSVDEPVLQSGQITPELKAVMYRCSGLPELNACVSSLILDGPTAAIMRQVAADLASIADWSLLSAREDVRAITATSETSLARSQDRFQQIDQLKEESKRLDLLMGEVEPFIENSTRSIALQADLRVTRLRASLLDAASAFKAEQQKSLGHALRYQSRRVWRCNTQPLRSELEQLFIAGYEQIVEETTQAEQAEFAEFADTLTFAIRGCKLVIKRPNLPVINKMPSIEALGEASAFYLSRPWQSWWRLWQSPQQKIKKLGEMIEGEFSPIIDSLVKSAAADVDIHLAHYERRMQAVGQTVLHHLRKQREVLAERMQALARKHDLDSAEQQARLQAKQNEACSRAEEAEVVRASFVRLQRDLAELQTSDPDRD